MRRFVLTAVAALAIVTTTGCGGSAEPAGADPAAAAAVESPAHGGARLLFR